MNFNVGDKVKCMDIGGIVNPTIKVGGIYTIKYIGKNYLTLEEVLNQGKFLSSRFEKVETHKPTQKQVISDIEEFKKINAEMCNTYQRKNADYGNSFSEQFCEYGMISSCIRLEDKLRRLKRLSKHEAQVTDEKLEDTLLDMSVYAILTVIELRKQHNTQEE